MTTQSDVRWTVTTLFFSANPNICPTDDANSCKRNAKLAFCCPVRKQRAEWGVVVTHQVPRIQARGPYSRDTQMLSARCNMRCWIGHGPATRLFARPGQHEQSPYVWSRWCLIDSMGARGPPEIVAGPQKPEAPRLVHAGLR